MLLSEIKGGSLFKGLVYGDPGAGKTCFAAGFPGPILYFDFDNKVSSAARFYRDEPARLADVEVKTFSAALKHDPMTEFFREIELLIKMQKSGVYTYKTLVIDSMTTFSSACLQHIISSNPGIKGRVTAQGIMPDKPHYGILLKEFERLIPGLLTLDMNVIVLGHLTVYKNEDTGVMIREVMCDGSFSSKLPIYFDEVYYAYKGPKGEYLAQTQNSGGFTCRSSITGLPQVIPLSYAAIAKYL